MERVNLDVQMDQEPATHFHSYVMDSQTAVMDQMKNTVTYVRSCVDELVKPSYLFQS